VTIARRVVVRGSVQGVFFRETARRRARRAGVAGWVRNNDDGTVEAWFEGEPDDVEVMLHFAETGPSGAYVEKVDVEDVEPEGLRGFEVR
jgi:acylphosphatase